MTTSIEAGNQKPGSLWSLLIGIIDKPAATFAGVIARRRWWLWAVPIGLVVAAMAVATVVNLPYTQELAREQAEQQLSMLPAEQAQAARTAMETSLSYPVLLASGLGFGALALVVGILAQATFLYFGALMAGGDDMQFGAVFTVSAWTRLPVAIGFLVQAGYTAAAGRMLTHPGLSFLVATGDLLKDARNPMFALLGRVDIFWLWHLLLVVVGVSVAARFGRGKSLALALVYAALSLGITVLPVLLFAGMAG